VVGCARRKGVEACRINHFRDERSSKPCLLYTTEVEAFPPGDHQWYSGIMASSTMLKMGDRGRIVIPQQIREAQGLNTGDTLVIFEDEKGMTLMTRNQLKEKVQANYREYPKSMADELIADRRAEALRDCDEEQREAA